ncbi:MAG TPA: hypothetical protein VHX18_03540 [Rhizomicrobium sp.]|jgi:hypothetical protein|nr:hypothetical protein [Rhizomicrobium sp.]
MEQAGRQGQAYVLAVALLLLSAPALAQVQTTLTPAPPNLPQVEKSPDDPDSTYCRPPQKQSDSRLLGPKVCMTNRQWDALHAQGLDISADGKGTVASEKYRSLHSGPCHTQQDSCY